MKTKVCLLILLAVLLGACTSTPSVAEVSSPTEAPVAVEEVDVPEEKDVEPVEIPAFCTLIGLDADIPVASGTPVIITWGWVATTEAQVADHLEKNITTVTLDGQALEAVSQSDIHQLESNGYYEVVLYSDEVMLDTGRHALVYDVAWTESIDDGFDIYGPGGDIETLHDECFLVVE